MTESRTISSIEELRPLSRWARQIAERLGCSSEVCDDLDLCLHEVVVNVILHGYGRNAPGEITVEMERRGTKLQVTIQDHARPFDPLSVPLPEPVPLELASPSGRGLVMIRGIADAVRYERKGEFNRLAMEFEVGAPE